MPASMLPTRDEVQVLIQSLNDVAASYDDAVTARGFAARSSIINRAKDLISQLRNPMDIAEGYLANANELVAIRTCLHLKALNAIPYPGSASLKEIADSTTASSQLLERLLRMLVCTGFLISPGPRRYAHTKHSHAFTLVPGPGMFFQLAYDESFLMIDNLHMYLSEKGYSEPLDERYSPYAWKSKQEGTPIYEIMAQYPARLHAFQAGLAHADASVPLLGYYDFGQLSEDKTDRPIFVDVGGGAGHVISQILEAYPQLDAARFVLQDLPPVIKKAAENEALPKQVQKLQHNFFTEQPIKGAKAYFLRRILHDFSDPFCVDILSKIIPAMAPDSRILVADLMLPEDATANEVGIASFDMTMFNMGGKQRTEACFKQVLEDAGCELVKIWKSDIGFGVIVEARLKGSGERIVDGPIPVEHTTPVTVPSIQQSDKSPPGGRNGVEQAAGINGTNGESQIVPQPDNKPESASNGIENREGPAHHEGHVDEAEQTEAPKQATIPQDPQPPPQEIPLSTDQEPYSGQFSHQPLLAGQESETHPVATEPDNQPDTNGNGDLSASPAPPIESLDLVADSNGASTRPALSQQGVEGTTKPSSEAKHDNGNTVPKNGEGFPNEVDGKGSATTDGGIVLKPTDVGSATIEVDEIGLEATEGGAVKPVGEPSGDTER